MNHTSSPPTNSTSDLAIEKVVFLDIDGVLNSLRTALLTNGFPHDFSERSMKQFDSFAIQLIQRLCSETGASVVLSSSWRILFKVHEVANGLNLPIIDRTPNFNAIRGKEIKAWLEKHPGVTHYVIIDDNSDMCADQKDHFVQTDGREGFLLKDYVRAMKILGAPDEKIRELALSFDTPL
jgi:hypothetical protein